MDYTRYQSDPIYEINLINEIKDIIIKDNRQKIIISNYQILPLITNTQILPQTNGLIQGAFHLRKINIIKPTKIL